MCGKNPNSAKEWRKSQCLPPLGSEFLEQLLWLEMIRCAIFPDKLALLLWSSNVWQSFLKM